jgi:hypothetical protein
MRRRRRREKDTPMPEELQSSPRKKLKIVKIYGSCWLFLPPLKRDCRIKKNDKLLRITQLTVGQLV